MKFSYDLHFDKCYVLPKYAKATLTQMFSIRYSILELFENMNLHTTTSVSFLNGGDEKNEVTNQPLTSKDISQLNEASLMKHSYTGVN